MDRNFSQWYLETKMQMDHEILTRRWKGVETFEKTLGIEQIFELSRLFYQMDLKNNSFEEEFRAVFQDADKAFLMKGNALELAVLAGAVLRKAVKRDNRDTSLIAAYATVCANFGGEGKNPAVPDIVNLARGYLSSKSAELRHLDGTKRILFPHQELIKGGQKLATFFQANDVANISSHWDGYSKKLISTLEKCVEVSNLIQREHLLHREESDILWWVMGEYSRDLEAPMRNLQLPVACLVASKELADLTRILPGPFAAPAFLDKVLRSVFTNLDKPITFSEGINQADGDWRKAWFQNYNDIDSLDLCPILFAVGKSTEESGGKNAWERPFEVTTKLSPKMQLLPLSMAMQIYEECLFVRSIKNAR